MTVDTWHNYVADGVVHHNTLAGAAEVAMHVTGLYPDWWNGYRFHRPTTWIVGSESAELTRKGVQRLLLGPPQLRNEWGTGAIPKSHLTGHAMRSGVADAVASITVKNEYGGESIIQFGSYDQGRMQHVDSRVLTPTGWRRIGDLAVGDDVIAGDGSPTKVLGVFPHGVKRLFRLTFDSGVSTLAGGEHLWEVCNRTRGPRRVVDTDWLIRRYGLLGETPPGNDRVSMPHVGVVQFQRTAVAVDPYLVGALLGDGCLRGGRIRFTSQDPEIVENVRAGAAALGAELVHWGGIQYGFKSATLLAEALDDYGMLGLLAHVKRVPRDYLINNPEIRLAVLQGLMDTDGSVSKKGSLSFASTSLGLAEDVAFLVRSFGGKATIRPKHSGRARVLHHVSIRFPQGTPFRLSRKIARMVRPLTETDRHILRSIVEVPAAEAVCIAVEHPSALYVTDDFIVTHNTKWQADTLDGVWMDEEPPMDIYSEALTRTNATGGIVFITFTPLLGMSAVVRRFLKEKPEGTGVVTMTIEDAEHYTPEERAKIIAAYPEHEREARARGIPMMGSGQVFPIAESIIKCDPFPIPAHWARINAMDFGIEHPAAFVRIAHDRDTDTLYVYDCWRVKGRGIMEQAGMILAKGCQHEPWAWPHDGLQRDKGSAVPLKNQFAGYGINMLPGRAEFEKDSKGVSAGVGVEAGLSLMLERMQTRRFRVFSHLNDWFEELRMYHRKDGVVVKEDEDLISASRYGTMMLRKALTPLEISIVHPSSTFGLGMGLAPSPGFQVFDPTVGY